MKSQRLIGAGAAISLLGTIYLIAYVIMIPGTQFLAALASGALATVTVRLIGHYAALICVDGVFEAAVKQRLDRERKDAP